jgi:hypothetical protein
MNENTTNIAIAKALGLDTTRLISFTLEVRAGSTPIVRAVYGVLPLHVIDGELVTAVREYRLVEQLSEEATQP